MTWIIHQTAPRSMPRWLAMNIYLIPYNFSRHLVVSLFVGGAALIAWWMALTLIVVGGPIAWDMGLWWSQSTEGFFILGGVGGAVSFASVFAEGSLLLLLIAYYGHTRS